MQTVFSWKFGGAESIEVCSSYTGLTVLSQSVLSTAELTQLKKNETD